MKKITRNLLISGAVIFAVGVAVFIIGMSALKWDFTRLDATEYTERAYVQAEGEQITSVKISVDSFGVVINSGESVSLDYYEASNSEVSVEVTDGVLNIVETRTNRGWFENGIFNIGRMNRKFVLTVTSGLPIEVGGTSTSVDMSGIETDKIEADCTNVTMKLSDCKISTLRVHSTNAHINMAACELGIFDVHSTNTSMQFDNSTCSELSVDSTNISVAAVKSTMSSASFDGTNVNLAFEDTSGGSLYADGTNTRCELDGITVNRLTLNGTNLTSRVSIRGNESEYTVTVDGDVASGADPEKTVTIDGVNIKSELKFI